MRAMSPSGIPGPESDTSICHRSPALLIPDLDQALWRIFERIVDEVADRLPDGHEIAGRAAGLPVNPPRQTAGRRDAAADRGGR